MAAAGVDFHGGSAAVANASMDSRDGTAVAAVTSADLAMRRR